MALVGLTIALTLAVSSRGGNSIIRIPIRQNSNDTSGVVIGSPVGSLPKVIRGTCLTQGCILGTVVGGGPGAAPTEPSVMSVSYRTPVDVAAGTVVHLEVQLSPE